MTVAETVLDAVAAAYADEPALVERLLLDLADTAGHADHMRHYPAATDYGRECAGAAYDAAREDLLAVLALPADLEGSAP
ncbi:hypothetical protein [Streptomyces sp. RKAG293]|uniref:hypothetical protein n=1 Tax=Streptomyces sp. RKAG293 TaxID=2893403 RepID=UPI0020345DB1|nr:hypothetical protein [Streptomyces sp. RKAG293]MCM2420280.1 hypothetical protein [Streptomyces sp. RKAG293]